ncbi:MAG: SPFH domain-containing protein [Pseudomonadota bacterium]
MDLIFYLLPVLLIVIFISQAIRVVPQGYEFTVERFGRYTHTLRPGLHILKPFIERIGAKVSVMETVLEVPSQDVITRDNAAVTVDGIVFFQIMDVSKSVYEVANIKVAILAMTMTNIRTVMGSMDLDELLSQRGAINARLLGVVDDATSPWGLKVTRIEIKDIRPPRDLVESMGRQMKAERDKRATILEAEGERQSAVLKAEGARQSAILEAEGEKQSMILEAEGKREMAYREAEGRERLAEAEASATRVLSQAIGEGNQQALNYFIAQKYVEALKGIAVSPNQKVLMMPLDTANIMGSIAGIAELLSKGDTAGTTTTIKSSPPTRTPPTRTPRTP